MDKPAVRHESAFVPLTKEQFRERFFARFYDPAFESVAHELEKVFETAWDVYSKYRKSPRQVPAGPWFVDSDVKLLVEWFDAVACIRDADGQLRHPASVS